MKGRLEKRVKQVFLAFLVRDLAMPLINLESYKFHLKIRKLLKG